MRLGKLVLNFEYVVDLDNTEMIQEAKACMMEDVDNIIKYNELENHISIIKNKKLKESDIPEFLLHNKDEV